MDDDRVRELIEAKDRIERSLLERGVDLDTEGRESISWALRTLTWDDGFTVEDAIHRILDVYRGVIANAA